MLRDLIAGRHVCVEVMFPIEKRCSFETRRRAVFRVYRERERHRFDDDDDDDGWWWFAGRRVGTVRRLARIAKR